MDNEMILRFKSLSQNEGFARSVAGAFAAQLNPTIEEISDIKMAVSEAVTNAIIHGYGNSPNGMIELRASVVGNEMSFSVTDEGRGIEDVEKAREPFFTTCPELDRSGMGFTVMETFMDAITVTSSPGNGTSVSMTKRLESVMRKDAQC